jgi:hypothetical protein
VAANYTSTLAHGTGPGRAMQKTTLVTPKQLLTGQKLLRPVNPSMQIHTNSLTAHAKVSRKQ